MASSNTKRLENKDSADLYSTPTIALDAIKPYLIKDIENIVKDEVYILEPCVGVGAISDWLIENMEGYNHNNPQTVLVHDNELHDYGYQTTYQCDFLSEDSPIGEYDLMVVNPPYIKAVEFILKGFEHAPIQWHFLRMSFLEGQKRFQDLFSLGKLSDVYIFTYRVSCAKGIDLVPSPNSVCYCWYRWDNSYYGQPRLHWLTKANLENLNV